MYLGVLGILYKLGMCAILQTQWSGAPSLFSSSGRGPDGVDAMR
jgi:hypothetical protein